MSTGLQPDRLDFDRRCCFRPGLVLYFGGELLVRFGQPGRKSDVIMVVKFDPAY